MRTRTAAAIAALLLAPLTACSSDTEADPAACKAAMVQQLKDATEDGEKGTRPPACKGLDDKTLERLAGKATNEWLDSDAADQAVEDAIESQSPEPDPTAQLSDECRAWIENELLDSSDSIDATDGYSVCGDLSEEELDQAIEQVTDDLIEQGATTP